MPAGRFRTNHVSKNQAVVKPGNVSADVPRKPRRSTNQATVANPDQQDRQRLSAYEQRRHQKGIDYKRRTQSDLRNFGFQGASYRQRDWRERQALLRGVIQARARQLAGEDLQVKPAEPKKHGYLETKMMGLDFGPKNPIKSKILQSIGQAGDIGLQTFPGLYQVARASGKDLYSTEQGHPTVKHLAPIAKGMVTGTKEDIQHPLRNIPRTSLDVLAAASAGAGLGARGVAGASAASEAAQTGARAGILKAALTRPTSEGGSLLFKPPPGVAKVTAGYKGPLGEANVVAPENHYFHDRGNGVWELRKMKEENRKGTYSIRASKSGAWRVHGDTYTLVETPDVGEYKPPTGTGKGGGGKRYRYDEHGNIVESGGYKNTLLPGTIKAPTGKKFIPVEGKVGKFKLVKDSNMIPGRTELPAKEATTYLRAGKSKVTYTEQSTAGRDFLLPKADNPLLRPLTSLKASMLQHSIDNPGAATFMGQRVPLAHEAMTAYKARVLGNDLVREGKFKAKEMGTSYTGKQFLAEANQHGLIGEDSLAQKMWNNRKVDEQARGKAAHFITHYGGQINRPFRFMGVYLRPAYFFTNYPGNVAMGAMNQGFKIVPALKRAGAAGRGSTRRLGHDAVKNLDSDVGSGRALSLTLGQETPELIGKPMFGSQRLGNLEKNVTSGISLLTDRQFRHASWDIRARELGYKTPEQQRALLTDPKHIEDRAVVKRLANKDAVDFDSLHPRERELVDLIYFYPWMSRATVWAGRAAVNKPIKSAVLANLAGQAQKRERADLGPFPGWMKGYAPAGHHKVINLSPLSTAATPGQVLQYAAGGRAGRRAIAEEFGTPAIQFMSTNPGDWYRNIIQSTGALGLALGKPSKTFPSNPFDQRLGRFTLGSPYVRREYSPKQVLSQAKKEMSPVEKANIDTQTERAKIISEARKLGLMQGYHLPPAIKAAYDRKHERELNRAHMAEKLGVNKLSGKDMFQADIDLLTRVGVWPKSEHDAASAWAKAQYKADPKYKFGKALSQLNKYFNYGTIISQARKGITDAGGNLD